MIKKHPNRRLYSMEESRFVTCDEVAMMIKLGAAPQVKDQKGQDVTAAVYGKIVSDMAREGLISAETLTPLILAAM